MKEHKEKIELNMNNKNVNRISGSIRKRITEFEQQKEALVKEQHDMKRTYCNIIAGQDCRVTKNNRCCDYPD